MQKIDNNESRNSQLIKAMRWLLENLWLPLIVGIIVGVSVNSINNKGWKMPIPFDSSDTVSTPEPATPVTTTPKPTAPEPTAPLIIAPVDNYPTNYWEGDYVIGTLISVESSNPIRCILDGTLFTFSDEAGSFSLGYESINADGLRNQIGSECRFNIDTAGYVVDVEVEFDFEGILMRIDYDESGNIDGIQIDYYDGSGGMAAAVPSELSEQLKTYLYVGNSYSVHFDIMGDISSITPI